MLKHKLTLLILLFYGCTIFSQGEANNWFFGNGAGITFNNGVLQTISGSPINSLETTVTISDENGNLLFYTNGESVWNRNHQIMDNGNGLIGSPSATQNGIAVEVPILPGLYYLFLNDGAENSNNSRGLSYSLINMFGDNGLGSVSQKNTELLAESTEKLTTSKHANGTGTWVITHKKESNEFLSYLVDGFGLDNTPIISAIGYIPSSNQGNEVGSIKVSSDGSKLSITHSIENVVELFDFNTSTGVVSNTVVIDNFLGLDVATTPNSEAVPYGIEFSPNNKYLYLSLVVPNRSGGGIIQYDITSGNSQEINDSAILLDNSGISNNVAIGAIEQGPNGQIFVANYITSGQGHDYIGVIERPNLREDLANYDPEGFFLDQGRCIVGLTQAPILEDFAQVTLDAQNFCLGDNTLFSMDVVGDFDEVLWDFGDGNTSSVTNPTHQYMSSGEYTVILTVISGVGTINVSTVHESINVIITSLPSIILPNDYVVEEINFDGFFDFDLTTKDNEILNGLDPNEYAISYHLTQNDADTGDNELISPYTNISNPQEIFARVINLTNPTCFNTTSFNLEVKELVTISLTNFIQCDDSSNTGILEFDLATKNTEVLGGLNPSDFLITYHATQDDADNNQNPLPLIYTNVSNPETLYVRLESVSDSSVFTTDSFMLIVSEQPSIGTIIDIDICDDISNDGIVITDLSTKDIEVLNGQDATVFEVFYFSSQADLEANQNALPTMYQNTSNVEQIFARIHNRSNTTCFDQSSFMLNIFNAPIANTISPIFECTTSTTGETIDLNNFESTILGNQSGTSYTITYHINENDAEVNQNPITMTNNYPLQLGTQTIYYRIENNVNTSCFAINNVIYTLLLSPTAGTATDINICDDTSNDGITIIDLSTKDAEILNGQDSNLFEVVYFDSQADLEANTNALPSIYQNTVNPQQIYARIHGIADNSCFDQSSFIINVVAVPIANTPSIIEICKDTSVFTTISLNLNDYIQEILGNQSSIDNVVTFHPTQSDADNGTNALNPNYTTANDQEILYARVENTMNTDCYATTTIDIRAYLLPLAGVPNNLELCGTIGGTEVTVFDLNENNEAILNGQSNNEFSISYHISESDADNKENIIPTLFETNLESTFIYARIENVSQASCYQIVNFELIVREIPILDIEENAYLCPGEAVELSVGANFDTYLWSTGATTPSIIVETAGDYQVTVGNLYGNSTCETTKTITVQASLPPTGINVITTDFTPNENEVRILAEGNGTYEYSIDGVTYQESNLFTNLIAGDYVAYVRDLGACETLTREFYLLSYPRFFTPNGDGFNEFWTIRNGIREPNNKIYIYDRLGKLLKSYTESQIGWDGTYNGNNMPSTDYWFLVERENGEIIKGHFTLKR